MVQQGGVSVNGKKVDAIDATFGKADFDDKDRILLKKGKKKFCQIKENN
jgi:tyrosyl-tRNA synthetase (EC 6.1.1.1)